MNPNGECRQLRGISLGRNQLSVIGASVLILSLSRDQIWVIISVEVAGTMAITQQMSNLDDLGARQHDNMEYNPFRQQQMQ